MMSYILDIKWLRGCSEVEDHTRGGSKSSYFTGQLQQIDDED